MKKWFLSLLILIIYNILYDSIIAYKSIESREDKKKEVLEEKNIADILIILLVYMIFLAGFFLIVFNNLIPRIIVIIMITIPVVLKFLADSFNAADSLKYILFENNNMQELSISEKLKFDIFVCGLLMVHNFIPMSKFVSFVETNLKSFVCIEIILSLYIMLCSYLITFIVLIELIIPLRHFRKGCEFIALKIGNSFKKLSLYFWKNWNAPPLKASLTNRFLSILKRQKILFKIMLSLLSIFVFVIDIIFNLILLIYYFIICYCCGAFIDIFLVLGKGILRILKFITKIPGHRVMKNTFRMSGIVAVLVTVIFNRIHLLFIPDTTFVVITEFFASAIVIPIIFEWIYSNRLQDKIEIKDKSQSID